MLLKLTVYGNSSYLSHSGSQTVEGLCGQIDHQMIGGKLDNIYSEPFELIRKLIKRAEAVKVPPSAIPVILPDDKRHAQHSCAVPVHAVHKQDTC